MMQLNNIINIDASNNYLFDSRNTAVNFITLPFDNNFVSVIPRYLHICNPEYLVFNLINNANNDITMGTIQNLLASMSLSLEISNNEIINLPLSLLWSLNSPKIINNKLYLFIQYNIFFGDISLTGLNAHSNITIKISNNSLQNYVSSYNLHCKIKMYSDNIRSQYIDMSDNPIQTINYINYRSNPRLEYQCNSINELFPGIIKGIFIESANIANELTELQFYIDSNLNRVYDEFLIKTSTTKINDNLIYFPFNPENSYNDRHFNSFNGSLHLSHDQNCVLNLSFNTPTNLVKIYVLKADVLKRSNYYTRIPTSSHNHGNSGSGHTSYGHTSYGHTSYGHTSYGHTSYGHTSYGHTGVVNEALPVCQTIYHPIDPERNTCSILHEQIIFLQTYMMCTACNSNFNENALKQWLQHRTGTRRTCPTCREVWTNYNIYINAESPSELILD